MVHRAGGSLIPESSPFVPLAMARETRALIPGSELRTVAGARHGRRLRARHRVCARALGARTLAAPG